MLQWASAMAFPVEGGMRMGKDIKGKELGIGISQRKDGLYTARYTGRDGKRRQRYFKKLQECRQWLADAEYEDAHGSIFAGMDMTVDAWFEYWIENVKSKNARPKTVELYMKQYKRYVSPAIGQMPIRNVLPIHCQAILNGLCEEGKHNATISSVRAQMSTLFGGALENGVVDRNPVTDSVRCNGGLESEPREAMTIEEQKAFLGAAGKSRYYLQYAFVLQTGLRVGELSALRWGDIDMKGRKMRIERTMGRINGEWREGPTKSAAGRRTVPLTDEAIRILEAQKAKSKGKKVSQMQYADLVFTGKQGFPVTDCAYDAEAYRYCDIAGIRRISMHILRHTFATRCIEAGMQPKTLQTILGHATIAMTMDTYVHVSDEGRMREMDAAQQYLVV